MSLQCAHDQEVNDKLEKEIEILEREITAIQNTDGGNKVCVNE